MQPIVLVNARVLLPGADQAVRGKAVIVADGRIVEVAPAGDARIGALPQYDARDGYLLPGFIDCQVNGGGDVLFNDAPSADTIRKIGAAHRQFGTTGFLPTLISDDLDVMRAAIAAVDAAIAAGIPGVLGIHLEGPYLATARRGIHDATKFRDVQSSDADLIASLRRGKTLVTLAPERIDASSLRALVSRGVIVAAGHTAADYALTHASLAAGVRGFTHLFNAMTPMGSREPGVVGAALEDRDSWCGMILDGEHVHPASVRVALAAKPCGKIFLVTDAMPPVGGKRDSFTLNGEIIHCKDGRCFNDLGVLAGSALDMATALRNAVGIGIPLAEAARMASSYPAAFLGIDDERGSIAPGLAADLVLLDETLHVRNTWIGGIAQSM